ncbi:MAG: hypothetical protein ABI237_12390 [Ginsengibacter sp.]
MKPVSFFSKFTFLCNIAFLLFLFFNKIEAKKPPTVGTEALGAIPFFKDLIIILGFSAIVINLIMCFIYLVFIIAKKTLPMPQWLTIVNLIFLPVQFYFFFFYNSLSQ